MLKNFLNILLVSSLGLFLSCTEEVTAPSIPTYYVHPELNEYLERFMEEAAMRNIVVDTAGINLELVSEPLTALDGSAACGLAHVYGKSFPNVQISQTCWDLFSAEHRETLMFHELGHALLDRPHFDPQLPVGSPVSMMNSNSSRVYNKFTRFKREYYVDELFGVNTEVPFWGKEKTETDTLFYYDVSEGAQPWSVLTDFVDGGGATTNIATDDTNNYAYRVTLPESGKGSSLRLTITLQKDDLPRPGASLDFSIDLRLENFDGPPPRMLLNATKISPLEVVHSGSSTEDNFDDLAPSGYSTISINPIDYFVDETDFINAEILISGESTGVVWLDNFTIIERF